MRERIHRLPDDGRAEPIVRRALRVGRADDPAEREAERTSERVVAWLRSSAESTAGGSVPFGGGASRIRRAGAATGAVVGAAGGELDEELGRRVARPGGGRPIEETVRSRFESAFGTPFGDVRVHTDSDVAPQIGARAFTLGSNVHFARGQYRPETTDGARTLAHELTHVVQQTGRVRRAAAVPTSSLQVGRDDVVRRDLGFEFESKHFFTKRRNDGGASLPAAAFASDVAAQGAFWDPAATRIKKGAVILDRADIEVQADDAGSDSDLEAVTTHFPETDNGRARLDTAMQHLAGLIQDGDGKKKAGTVASKALDGVHGFTNQLPDGMISGAWAIAKTAPQVTVGVRAKNIVDLVEDLHGRDFEGSGAETDRAAGRLHMRDADQNDPTKPKELAPGNEAATLVTGHRLARRALRDFKEQHRDAPQGDFENKYLEGFLTIVFAYVEAVQYKGSFLKSHTPLMAKTDLATIWSTLPEEVRTYYGKKKRLQELIATADGYANRMKRPVFDVDPTTRSFEESVSDKKTRMPKAKQWYHKLTLQSWLAGIVTGTDKLTSANFPKKPQDQEIEGYGALGNRMDTDVVTGTRLPVFELRSATKMMTYADAGQWALDVFDYVRSLNEHHTGDHQRMT